MLEIHHQEVIQESLKEKTLSTLMDSKERSIESAEDGKMLATKSLWDEKEMMASEIEP